MPALPALPARAVSSIPVDDILSQLPRHQSFKFKCSSISLGYCSLPSSPGKLSAHLSVGLNPNSELPCPSTPTCDLVSANSPWHPNKRRHKMADDLIQSSMAGAQPVPTNFNASDADNLEDVSRPPRPGVAAWGRQAEVSRDYLTDPRPPD